jgi:hypothetical protein
MLSRSTGRRSGTPAEQLAGRKPDVCPHRRKTPVTLTSRQGEGEAVRFAGDRGGAANRLPNPAAPTVDERLKARQYTRANGMTRRKFAPGSGLLRGRYGGQP